MRTFVDAFLDQAQARGCEPAVMDCHGADTYELLNRRSALLARKLLDDCKARGEDVETLRRKGKNGARIAVLLPRTRAYMTAVLAVLRAGCALIPLDTAYPKERIETILQEGEAAACITTKELQSRTGMCPAILPEEVFSEKEEMKADLSLNLSDSEIEGLIIFTSGSTGKPKGVLHRQSIFSHQLALLQGIHEYTPEDVICSMAGFTFIAAEVDLFAPLMTGGSVYIADETERKNPEMLFSLIRKRHITGMFLPPQMFTVMRELYGRLPLDYVLLAGEKARDQYADDGNVYESYGSSETFGVLIRPLSHGDPRMLGKAGAGARVWLLDEKGNRITEPGKVGELCVGGPWIAEGYIGLPEETAARFTACPFEPKERMYRTGDYMAWDGEGCLLFHGRKDRMVKLRGYRAELGEIENVMRTAPGVTDAACVTIQVNGAEKLCCYYLGEETDYATLNAHAKAFLPEYMIPDYTVWLEDFPRNDRHKVNYRALEAIRPPVQEEIIAPENETERETCDAFAAALNLQCVSVTADFFELGGTSISAALLIAHLNERYPGLSFQDVTQHPSPRKLAAFLEKERIGEKNIPAMDREYYPLTKTQMGIYLEAVMGGNSPTYSSPYLMQAAAGVAADQLITAVNALVSAHPSMKYIIRAGADGIPHMVMTPDAQIEVPVVDGKAENRLEFIQQFSPAVPITDALLFHFAVYRTKERCYLALRSHLIFLDGTSISLIIDELNRALAGEPLLREACTVQQTGVMEEQKMRDGTHDVARRYHLDLFRNMDELPSLHGDRKDPLTPGVSENLRYAPETLTTERVRAFCEKHQITESSFFLGAMALMLSKYLNSRSVSFSTVYNGRGLGETANTIGTLIKRIPVYGSFEKDRPVGEYLRDISLQVLSTMSHDIYSFDEVLKECPVNDDVEFIYQGDLFTDNMGASSGKNLIEGDRWFMEHYHTGMVTGLFSIQCFATGGFYNMTLEYRNERFSPEWAERFARNLFTIAEGMLTKEKIGEIEMLTDEDRSILARFNDTAVDIPFIPVQEQIHRHATETPDRTAVTAAGRSLTFRELDLLSNQLAAALREKGVGTETLVAVMLEREVWAYTAEIGILKAGGAFVPFLPDYPDDRIDICMEDGRIPLMITSDKLRRERTELSRKGYRLLTIEEIFGVRDRKEIRPDFRFEKLPETIVMPGNLAYSIYTSGTTGRPKGVMIEHRNIVNYVHRNEKSPEIMHYTAPGRVCLALASFSFDVSVVEAFVPLCNGNTVVIATEEEIHNPGLLARLILDNHVTGMTCTPTYLQGLLDIPEMREAISQITFFDIGAEAFPAQLYERLREIRKDSVILNVYGPTEATMGCAAEEMTGSRMVTVGPPIANTVFHVTDCFGNDLPVGIQGELIISGDQVGRGYINLPDKTAASFLRIDGLRSYRSGDLAAWTRNGSIRIFSRTDRQIKLRGFRIELDEIEKVMNDYPEVSSAAAAVKKKGETDYLAGWYTTRRKKGINEELQNYLRAKLPEYMVPQVLMELDQMPVTINGKVNRKALPAPDFSELRAEYVPPVTETEKTVCRAFAQALNQPESTVSVLDDFFDLGGDSLRAMAVLMEAGLEGMSAADVFRKRTPRAIAAAVEERMQLGSLDEREKAARRMPHMLTPLQIQMIDTQLFRPGSTMWSNMHFLARFDPEKVEAERLCHAVNQALQNHPALSVAFRFDENNDLVQQYVPGLLPEVKVYPILRETAEMLPAVLILPFHKILDSCLCRVGVYRSPDFVYLFMDIHHLLMDGGSLSVLLADIVNAYFGLELKKDTYFAILAEEEKKIADGVREADRDWFRERYGDEIWCNMPPVTDKNGSIHQASRERRLSFDVQQVRAAEEYWGVSHSVMAISAALMTLAQTTGDQHVMVNWIFNGRLAPETENAVGMLIKNLPAAARMEEYSDVRELLLSVKEQVAEGIAHSTYDFMTGQYQAYLNDCMEVNLQLEINGHEMEALHPTIIPLEDVFRAAGARLEMELLENEYGDGGFDSEMEYAEGLFDRERMDAFHDRYVEILETLIRRETPKGLRFSSNTRGKAPRPDSREQ